MASNIMFDRKWKIELQVMDKKGTQLVPNPNKKKTIKDIKVTFNIKNTLLGDASLATFQLYNVNSDTTALLTSHNCYFTFKTGYFSDIEDSWDVLFYGEITNSYELRQGVDIVWNVWARNASTLLNLNYPNVAPIQTETGVKQVLEDLTKDASGIKDKPTYLNGTDTVISEADKLPEYTPQGVFREEFDDLLDPLGLSWYVNFGELFVYDKTKSDPTNLDGAAIPISAKTGLLTVPMVDYVGVKFTHLLKGSLKPNTVIDIAPNTVRYELGNKFYVKQYDKKKWRADGRFKIMEVTHIGDTRGDRWHTDVTAFYRRNKNE